MNKTLPDSYVIDIRAEHTDDSPVPEGFVEGILNKKIIKRYRDYENRYKTNKAGWINKRTSISMGDIESGFSGKKREIYDIELTDNQILNIVKNLKEHYSDELISKGVLINIINASHHIGYIIMPYKTSFGGKTKNNKTKNNKRKNNKSRKNKK